MGDNESYPEWLIWLVEHRFHFLVVLAIASAVVLYARSQKDTDDRLHAIEDAVRYKPAPAYVAPELSAYAARDVSVASLPVHRAAYVPVYSHIYYDGGRPYLLETTLSVRNVDPKRPIYVSAVEYYDTHGKLVNKHVDRLIKLKPLQTIEFLVERHDVTGGSGANFIVEWHAATLGTHVPLIEAVMVGRSGTNAISFVRKSEPLPQWMSD